MSDELIAAAELGDQAKKFLESDLGQCLIGISRQEIEIAREKLDNVDPEDAKKIRELQNDIKVAKYFEQWLAELLSKGENALQIYIQQRGN